MQNSSIWMASLAWVVLAQGCRTEPLDPSSIPDGGMVPGSIGSTQHPDGSVRPEDPPTDGSVPGDGSVSTDPQPLIADRNDASRVVVRGGRVFWSSQVYNEVHSCSLANCTATVVSYSGFLSSANLQPAGIDVDDTHVYWSNSQSGNVVRCPIAGCPGGGAEIVVDHLNWPQDIVLDATDVYIASFGDSAILRCPKTGCVGPPVVVALTQNAPDSPAVDDSHVYWLEAAPKGAIRRVAKSSPGSPPESLADAENQPHSLVVAGGNAYWTTDWAFGAIRRCAVGGCGGAPTELASSQNNPAALAVDDTHIYWVSEQSGSDIQPVADGRILRCPLSGCAGGIDVIASGQRVSDRDHALALDASAAYWAVESTNQGIANGAVMTVRK